MSLKELEHQLPLAQNSLEDIELELEALMTLRDANIKRVVAMTAMATATLQSQEGV